MKNMVEWASRVTIVNSLLKGLRYVEEMSVAQLLEHPAKHVRNARLNLISQDTFAVPFRIANPASSEVMQPLCGW